MYDLGKWQAGLDLDFLIGRGLQKFKLLSSHRKLLSPEQGVLAVLRTAGKERLGLLEPEVPPPGR